ncbi:hypothetical protein L7F22_054803 [Adiantum nelumboides]|nr:hypothetical protein [Adiantum nelumboides]
MSPPAVLLLSPASQAGAQHLCRLAQSPHVFSIAGRAHLKSFFMPAASCPSTRKGLHVSAAYNSNRYNSNYNDYYDDIVVDMDPEKMLKPGDPNTFQATIRKAMPVGYWVTMPSGREAFLPAQDLGFLGGLEKLRSIFQPGQEVTVRVVTRGGSGREVLSLKKPDPNKPDPPPKPLRKEFEGGRRRRPSQY